MYSQSYKNPYLNLNTNLNMNNNSNWEINLKNYLFNDLLKLFVPNETIRSSLVSNEAMEIWKIIFTHSSYDGTIGKNYESYELLGDRFLDANFVLYLLEKYLYKITPFELTEIKRFYMSKVYQAQLGRKLGLVNHIRTSSNIDISIHIVEDIFESFAGGLIKVGMLLKSKNEKGPSLGAGNILVFNFIVYLFKDIDIDFTVAKGHPKSVVKQMFDKLHWGKPIENTYTSENSSQVVSILLTQEAVDDLAKFGVIITNRVIGQDEAWSKSSALPNAYLQALKTLNNMGITDLWISQRKVAQDMSNPQLAPLFNQANKKMIQQGYTSIIFKISQTTREGKIMQLIGILPDNTQEVLVETTTPVKKERDGKEQLLNLYINKK